MELIIFFNISETIHGFTETREPCQFFNLISIIKSEQNESIKANLILITQMNFIVFFDIVLFVFMALAYIGTIKLRM